MHLKDPIRKHNTEVNNPNLVNKLDAFTGPDFLS